MSVSVHVTQSSRNGNDERSRWKVMNISTLQKQQLGIMLEMEHAVQKLREKSTGKNANGMKKVKKATAWRRDMVAVSSVLGQCQLMPWARATGKCAGDVWNLLVFEKGNWNARKKRDHELWKQQGSKRKEKNQGNSERMVRSTGELQRIFK